MGKNNKSCSGELEVITDDANGFLGPKIKKGLFHDDAV